MDAGEARLENKNRKNDLLRRAGEMTGVEVKFSATFSEHPSVSDILGEIGKDIQLIIIRNN